MRADATRTVRADKQLVQVLMDRDLVELIDQAATRARWTRTRWITEVATAALPPEAQASLGIDRP